MGSVTARMHMRYRRLARRRVADRVDDRARDRVRRSAPYRPRSQVFPARWQVNAPAWERTTRAHVRSTRSGHLPRTLTGVPRQSSRQLLTRSRLTGSTFRSCPSPRGGRTSGRPTFRQSRQSSVLSCTETPFRIWIVVRERHTSGACFGDQPKEYVVPRDGIGLRVPQSGRRRDYEDDQCTCFDESTQHDWPQSARRRGGRRLSGHRRDLMSRATGATVPAPVSS